ncbi:MAG TPA: polysaccharide deacetylase family protein [Thiolinea sp.]|nr:polysaccharide deacetylase family protein [Thiolinea sp.]
MKKLPTTPKNRRPALLPALLPAVLGALLLTGCDETGNDQPATDTQASALQQEAREAALYDEVDSLNYLSDQAAKRSQQTEAEALEEWRSPQALSARSALRTGEYDFTPPPAPPISRPGQLLNLPAVTRPRFTVTDRQWPAAGEVSIAMWSQDKLSAFSLSIDDNHVQDHAFWFEMGERYGWKWTWFVIANQVGWGAHDHWGHWQQVQDKGHDVQTHTYSHLCDALFYTYREYRQSQVVIDQNVEGARVVTMGYPFGSGTNKAGSPCAPLTSARTQNDRTLAAKYFLAARDVYGALTNPASIDFLSVPSVSSARNFLNAAAPWAYFDATLDPDSGNWRSWYSAHFHGLYAQTDKDYVIQILDHLKDREADVWVGSFTAVARYAQEFATARIVNLQQNAGSTRFEVRDDMNDSWFDEPLTLKLRLPAGKTTASATQQGMAIPASVVMQAGMAYALVDAKPDQGVVVINY